MWVPATWLMRQRSDGGAYVTQRQSNGLGSIAGVNYASASTNVGIGTTAPVSALDIQGGSVHIEEHAPSYPAQGACLGWNMSGGQGESDFVNNEGLGSGGWFFVNTNSSGGYSGW